MGEESVPIVPIRGLRGGADHQAERIPELAPLRKSSVSVVGLGTLGSPLAKEMARSMVAELHPVDYDFVDPATSVRFESGYELAGISKPLGLADTFRRNYPHTRVVPHHIMIGGDSTHDGKSDAAELRELIDQVDLVIDATAEDNVTAAITDRAWQADVTSVVLWSIEGVGGVVLRLVPGETGCFYCMELHISSEGGTIDLPKPPAESKRVQPPGCADPTFTSPAADMQPLVSMASRLSFGELCKESPVGYPRYENDLYVLWLRKPDGSLYDPPTWESHKLPVHPDCPCHADSPC